MKKNLLFASKIHIDQRNLLIYTRVYRYQIDMILQVNKESNNQDQNLETETTVEQSNFKKWMYLEPCILESAIKWFQNEVKDEILFKKFKKEIIVLSEITI